MSLPAREDSPPHHEAGEMLERQGENGPVCRGSAARQQEQAGRRRNLSLVLTLLGALAALGLVWLLLEGGRLGRGHTAGEPHCQLLDDLQMAHILEEQDQIRVPSDDFRSLVKFAGALQYLDETPRGKSLLPLRLKSVSVESGGGPDGERALVLWTSCARLKLQLASDNKQLLVGSIELETARVGNHLRACRVGATSMRLANATQRRYSSRCEPNLQQAATWQFTTTSPASSNTPHDCKWSHWRQGGASFVQKTIARLLIHSLEFELDGSEALIRQNQFSKPSDCSP